jgi:hypothetical protein
VSIDWLTKTEWRTGSSSVPTLELTEQCEMGKQTRERATEKKQILSGILFLDSRVRTIGERYEEAASG